MDPGPEGAVGSLAGDGSLEIVTLFTLGAVDRVVGWDVEGHAERVAESGTAAIHFDLVVVVEYC